MENTQPKFDESNPWIKGTSRDIQRTKLADQRWENKENETFYLKANDSLEIYHAEGMVFKSFVLKKSSQYPFWTLQPKFSE